MTNEISRLRLRLCVVAARSNAEVVLQLSPGLLILLILAWPSLGDEPQLATGPEFRQALQEPFVASWKTIELRDILNQIQKEQQVALLLDRRVDSSLMPDVNLAGSPLLVDLSHLAVQLKLGISVPQNLVYLGPLKSAQKLRTLIALRSDEIPSQLKQAGQSREDVAWSELTEPRGLAVSIADSAGVRITNPNLIEHDLWPAAQLPQVTAVEALSILLVQFDLTFQFLGSGNAIELTTIPDIVEIERTHKLPAKSPDKLYANWQARYPDLKFQRTGREVRCLATVEVHEDLDDRPLFRRGNPAEIELARRNFSLKIKDVPARALMIELEKSGVKFVYDQQAFRAAKIDLEKLIELDVRDLPADKFFDAVFRPLRLTVKIDANTVNLAPQ